MDFKVGGNWVNVKTKSGWTALLSRDNWDDFHYKTTFYLRLVDPDDNVHDIGSTKISQLGLEKSTPISAHPIPEHFDALDESFFSLGISDEYYANLKALGNDIREDVLISIRDVAFDLSILAMAENDESFQTSLMRSQHVNTVRTQYHRLANGGERYEAFTFAYTYPNQDGATINFSVVPGSNPPTNVHVLIGRNAVGKTTLLSRLENLVLNPGLIDESTEAFGFIDSQDGTESFWNLGTVAFSAFDTFGERPSDDSSSSAPNYHYFGLKKQNLASVGNENIETDDDDGSEHDVEIEGGYLHKSRQDLVEEFSELVRKVLNFKRKEFAAALQILNSDPLIGASLLYEAAVEESDSALNIESIVNEFREMSSGHKIVVLTIAGLVSCVDEKTLILIDEPETHLHPPLLSAFIRAVSNLLIKRNGVAIIATHSPVVLQEVPQSCVWKLSRSGDEVMPARPSIETFGENVGTLTREVFGLEVERSGFYEMVSRLVSQSDSYEEVLEQLDGQLGAEGKAIVRVLLTEKDADDPR
jgi:predicted ATPase